MNYMLDTNAYSDIGRKGIWLDFISTAKTVYMPSTVLGELREGFLNGSQRLHNEKVLDQFIREPVVHICDTTSITATYYAQLKNHLKLNGKPIPTNDIWIAASCLEYQSTLLTRDKHFQYLPQVSIIFAD